MTRKVDATATANANASANTNAAPKKKAAPKSRKRKASDAVSTGTSTSSANDSGKATTAAAKRAATYESRTPRAGDHASGHANANAGDNHATSASLKPFVRGELVESIKHMMFGFGDDEVPLDDSAALMEDLVVEYIECMTKKAMEISAIKGKLDTECFIFLIRKDPERYERITELLRANEEFRAVLNSGFDPSDEKMY